MRMPVAINSAPPTVLIARVWRRSTAREPVTQLNPAATSRKGMPSPRQYTTPRSTPRGADAVSALSASTTDRVGPMHGVQPIPNITPSSGAPASPAPGVQRGVRPPPPPPNPPPNTKLPPPLHDSESTDEHEPHRDEHGPRDTGDGGGVVDEPSSGRPRKQVHDNKNEGESENEERDPPQQPTSMRAGRCSLREPTNVAEVPRNQRQNAG